MIAATRHQTLPVRAERRAVDNARVPVEGHKFSAAGSVPDPNRSVMASRSKSFPVGTECHAIDAVAMPGEIQFVAGAKLPEVVPFPLAQFRRASLEAFLRPADVIRLPLQVRPTDALDICDLPFAMIGV